MACSILCFSLLLLAKRKRCSPQALFESEELLCEAYRSSNSLEELLWRRSAFGEQEKLLNHATDYFPKSMHILHISIYKMMDWVHPWTTLMDLLVQKLKYLF